MRQPARSNIYLYCHASNDRAWQSCRPEVPPPRSRGGQGQKPLPFISVQVEFGAHQVVLVRSRDSVERLPEGLRDSNALVLTVPQVSAAAWLSASACCSLPQLGAELVPHPGPCSLFCSPRAWNLTVGWHRTPKSVASGSIVQHGGKALMQCKSRCIKA